jgi:hypothetical protein
MRAVVFGLGLAALALAACDDGGLSRRVTIEHPPSISDGMLTYTVTAAVDEGATVRYEVLTSEGEVRFVRYGDAGLVNVETADGAIVAEHNRNTGSAVDRLVGKLELWSDPVVGYAALGFDNPLPHPVEAPDAVTPASVNQTPYESGCTRYDLGTWQSDGCTQGAYVDDCGAHVYLLVFQKKSGCFLGFFCDCDGESAAYEL